MSEEKEIQEGGLTTMKKTIIGIATTAVTAIGGYVATHIEAIFGGGEEATKTEQVAPAMENKQKQEVNVSGPTINLTIPEQKSTPTQVIRERVVEKAAPAPAPAPKKVEDESDPW
jgi:hypothetical protein